MTDVNHQITKALVSRYGKGTLFVYRSNDDRIGAMNLYTLGTMYVSGDTNPRFGVRKVN